MFCTESVARPGGAVRECSVKGSGCDIGFGFCNLCPNVCCGVGACYQHEYCAAFSGGGFKFKVRVSVSLVFR